MKHLFEKFFKGMLRALYCQSVDALSSCHLLDNYGTLLTRAFTDNLSKFYTTQ